MDATDLEAYLSKARDVLAKFEARLGWQAPNIKENGQELVVCPHDPAHKVPHARLEAHTKKCKWRKMGYSFDEIDDILEQEDITTLQGNKNLVNTDDIVEQVAPNTGMLRTEERYKSVLSCDQRLAVHEAEVAKLYSSRSKMPDNALYVDLAAKAAEKLYEKENPENLSEFELKQKLRDMKRRRQTYRAKNVHITKRSQTEIIRGVLEVHMEELTKLWNPDKAPEFHQQDDEARKEQSGELSRGEHQKSRRRHFHENFRREIDRFRDSYSKNRGGREYDGRRDNDRPPRRESERRYRYSPPRKKTRRSRSRDRDSTKERKIEDGSTDDVIRAIRDRTTNSRKEVKPESRTQTSETQTSRDFASHYDYEHGSNLRGRGEETHRLLHDAPAGLGETSRQRKKDNLGAHETEGREGDTETHGRENRKSHKRKKSKKEKSKKEKKAKRRSGSRD